jgi:tetratricopeptide (TPR) repeat protein
VKTVRILICLLAALILCSAPAAAKTDANLTAARDAQTQGNYPEALRLYAEIIDSGTGDKKLVATALLERASLNLVLGQNLDRALTDANRVLAMDPDNGAAYLLKGLYHRAKQDPEKALIEFDMALKVSPQINRTYLFKGLTHFGMGNLEMAAAAYEKLDFLMPHHARAFLQLARAYSKLNQPQNAMKWCNKALSVDPHEPTALMQRATVWQELRQPEKALQDFNGAIKAAPGKAAYYVMRSGAYMSLKKYGEAMADLGKAMNMDRNDYLPLWWRARLRSYLGNQKEALSDLEAAQKLSRNNASVILDRGRLNRKMGYFQKAGFDFKLGMKILPNDPDFAFAMGMLEFMQGRFKIAAQHIEKSLADPKQVVPMRKAWYCLALLRAGEKCGLMAGVQGVRPADWPNKVIAFMQDEMAPSALSKSAQNLKASDGGEALCQTYYFFGQSWMLKGDLDQAVQYLMECIKRGPASSLAYEAALAELKRLHKAPPKAQATLPPVFND